MKKILLLSLILLAISATAQRSTYHPFPDSNTVWNWHMTVYGFPPTDNLYSIIFSGDTLINSVNYHKLKTPYVQQVMKSGMVGYRGAIRQDAPGRRVFIVPAGETAEQLLYDFNMQVGDSVRGYTETGLNPLDVVESIDSVMVGTDYHKRWKINTGYDIYFIEGIGSTYGLIEHSPGTIVDWASISLTCFQQDGHTLYPDTLIDCPVITSVKSGTKKSGTFTVFPNPTNGSFHIEFDDPRNIGEIRLTDLTGKIILQQKTKDQARIKIDDLDQGIYFLTVTDKNDRSTTRKIISY
ncbi:MAG: T9SS type A sorting domain-containing protein [Bacteroidetes bacterium]|nr:T9SS type A sorting domain-containing protein [Bacteroidota bacterium]